MANIFKNIQNLKSEFFIPLMVDHLIKQLADECDVVLVVGSPNSSNSNRLRELAERMGKAAYLVDNADELKQEWFEENAQFGQTEKVDTETGEVSTIFCLFCKPSRDEIMSW